MALSQTRFYWLDLFRFMAALTVVLGHVRQAAFVEYGGLAADQKSLLIAVSYALTRMGKEAVIMFFVLSGFLVGGRALERIADGSYKPLDYAIDRFTRIMLPLFPALVLTAIIGLIIGSDFNYWHFIGNLFSLQGIFVPSFEGNYPLWSLSYEVWFYILVWAVGVAALNRRLHLISAALLVLIAAIFTHLSPTYLFCWLIGAFAYLRRPGKFSLLFLIVSIMLSLYAIISVQIGTDSVSIPVESFRHMVPSQDISKLLLASGMALLIQQALMVKPIKSSAIKLDLAGTKLAAFSYTLYLIHYPLIQLMSHLGINRAPRINLASVGPFLLMVSICLTSSWGLYLMFEKRTSELRKLLHSFTSK
jgi:peptidoglycan/LPS O-acetylase OafA/YrhL